MNLGVGPFACHLAVLQIQKRNELDEELYISGDKYLFYSSFRNKDAIETDAELTFDRRELPEQAAKRMDMPLSYINGQM